MAGIGLSGDFFFEQMVLDREDQSLDTLRMAASDVTVSLGDGQQDFLSLSNGTGYLLLIDTVGLAGTLRGDVAINLPDMNISGTVGLEINRTGLELDETFTVDRIEQTLELEAGNYLRLSGTDVSVELAGQTLRGDFAFSQEEDSVRMSSKMSRFRRQDTDFATVTQGVGSLEVAQGGVEGSFAGTLALSVPDVTLGAAVTVVVNTLGEREVFMTATNVTINVLNQVIEASPPTLESVDLPSGESVISLSLADFELSLNDGGASLLTVTVEAADLIVNSEGMGLRVTGGSVTTGSLPAGVSLEASDAKVVLNTTSGVLDLGGGEALQAGPYLRIELPDATLTVAGIGVLGGIVFDQETDEEGGTITRVAVADGPHSRWRARRLCRRGVARVATTTNLEE